MLDVSVGTKYFCDSFFYFLCKFNFCRDDYKIHSLGMIIMCDYLKKKKYNDLSCELSREEHKTSALYRRYNCTERCVQNLSSGASALSDNDPYENYGSIVSVLWNPAYIFIK